MDPRIVQIQKTIKNQADSVLGEIVQISQSLEKNKNVEENLEIVSYLLNKIIAFQYRYTNKLKNFWRKIDLEGTGLDIEVQYKKVDFWENQYKYIATYSKNFYTIIDSIDSESCIDDCINRLYWSPLQIISYFSLDHGNNFKSLWHEDFLNICKDILEDSSEMYKELLVFL